MSDETPDQPVDDSTDDVPTDDDAGVEAPRRSRMALGVSLVVAVIVAGFVGVLATREPSTDREVKSALLDKAAPPLVGQTLDGEAFNLDHKQGRWVVVNFFATWCRECVVEHPQLDAFQKQHEEADDALVVSVVYDDDPDDALEFFEERGGDWPVVLDDSGIAASYGVTAVPETYLVNPDGYVVAKFIAGVTRDGLNGWIQEYYDDLAADEREGSTP